MTWHLERISAPLLEPVTLDEAKAQCRVRHSLDDDRLTRLIASAREQAEARTRRALISQGWRQTSPASCGRIRLERWPVLAVTAVQVDGQQLDLGACRVRLGDDGYVEPLDGWPGREVVVEFTAGYGSTAASVPASIRDWMLVQIADAYGNPGAVVIGTITSRLDYIDGLLTPFEVPR